MHQMQLNALMFPDFNFMELLKKCYCCYF